jgi:hypothetical protein
MKHAGLKAKIVCLVQSFLANLHANERGNLLRFSEFLLFFGAGPLGAIPLNADDAQESQGLALIGSKLVPRHGRNLDHVIQSDLRRLFADQHLSTAPNDRHDMGVLMAFKGGVAALAYFEISKFDRQVVPAMEKNLACHALENSSVFFVREKVDALPSVVPAMLSDH